MNFEKCQYRESCKHYDKDAICCTFLYKLCIYKRHEDKMAEIRDIGRKAEDLSKKVVDL